MKTARLTLLFCAALLGLAAETQAHAEHDKPRYVGENGADQGRCDKPDQPCKTIGYAAQQASKGDNILISSGSYEITDVNTLFYLISDVVPVKGGYSTKHYKRDTNSNPTRLIGVPHEYADALAARGFTVIVDRKSLDDTSTRQLAGKMAALEEMRQQQIDVPCSNGVAGQFSCNKLDLVAHLPLSAMGNSSGGNDIWGHFDLNDGREYALMGLRNGVAIVDISQAESPRLVTHIPGQDTTWRDIKVLQTYSTSDNLWQSYAYVTADNASMGLQVIDLNELPERATLVKADKTDLSAHNIYLSNVDYSTGVPLTGMQPYLHIAGSNNYGGAFNSYSLANPAAPAPLYRHTNGSRSDYSHDVASMTVFDERKDTQCVNATHHCEILFDFNENDIRLWDKTDNQLPVELSRTVYPQASYVHSGWWSEDKLVMMVHDELDEQNWQLNTTLRFFDISNFRQPVLLSTYTGPTRAIDHNGFVRGNRYYMSNYERGLTVLDISNPAQPIEAGFFDTYPVSDSPSFNGAWGTYPFLPSGLVLISDINSGLYLVRDNTLAVPQGSFSFTSHEYPTTEGTSLAVEVTRTGASAGAVSVDYETHIGSALGEDFSPAAGSLSWADGEGGSKSFSVDITADTLTNELHEIFFVRLFDPRGGASITSPSLAQIKINGLANKGRIRFSDAQITLPKTATPTAISLRRNGGREGSVSARLVVNEAAQAAFTLNPTSVTWADNEAGVKTVTLTPNLSNPLNQSFTISLDGDNLSSTGNIQLQINFSDGEPVAPPPGPSGKSGGGAVGLPCLGLILWLLLMAKLVGRRPFSRCFISKQFTIQAPNIGTSAR